jgi:hypothetical protein
MAKRQRTNKDLQKSSPKSDLWVLEKYLSTVGTKYFSSTQRSALGDDFCRSLFVLCLLAICCPSVFDLWILITSLVSSNSSYIWKVRNSSLRNRGLQPDVIIETKYNISMNQLFTDICQRRKNITNTLKNLRT